MVLVKLKMSESVIYPMVREKCAFIHLHLHSVVVCFLFVFMCERYIYIYIDEIWHASQCRSPLCVLVLANYVYERSDALDLS